MAHKWQDWASFALSLWLAISPWIMGFAENEAATWNAVAVGLALALFSHFECVACEGVTAEWLNLAAGVWLVCAPFVLEFTAARVATATVVVVGAFIVALAISALSLDKQIGKLWHKPQ